MDSFQSFVLDLSEGHYFGEVELVQDTVRISSATSKSPVVVLRIGKKRYLKSFYHTHEGLSEFRLRMHGEETPLVFVLRHAKAYDALKLFLESEYSTEGLMFWHHVDILEHFCQRELDTQFPQHQNFGRVTSFAAEYEQSGFMSRKIDFLSKAAEMASTSDYDVGQASSLMMVVDMAKSILEKYIVDNATEQQVGMGWDGLGVYLLSYIPTCMCI